MPFIFINIPNPQTNDSLAVSSQQLARQANEIAVNDTTQPATTLRQVLEDDSLLNRFKKYATEQNALEIFLGSDPASLILTFYPKLMC